MKKRMVLMLAALICVNTLVACGTTKSGTTSDKQTVSAEKATGGKSQKMSAEATKPETSGDTTTVKIWHDGNEAIMQTITDEVNARLAGDNIRVQLKKRQICQVSLSYTVQM